MIIDVRDPKNPDRILYRFNATPARFHFRGGRVSFHVPAAPLIEAGCPVPSAVEMPPPFVCEREREYEGGELIRDEWFVLDEHRDRLIEAVASDDTRCPACGATHVFDAATECNRDDCPRPSSGPQRGWLRRPRPEEAGNDR